MSKNADLIRARGGVPVRLGLILGSGLGHLAAAVDGVSIPYADLDGFPHIGVSGHNPNLVIGTLEGVPVAVFGAREHYYENGNPAAMRPALELLRELGGEMLIATNRHPWRPAHLHFMIIAEGYETLTTHVFRNDDQYLDSDAVFGVRQSLVTDWTLQPDGSWLVDYDFVLNPVAA